MAADQHSVRVPTEGQQRWIERIWKAFGTPFIEPEYGFAPDGVARVVLNGLVFVCTPDSRCHLEFAQSASWPDGFKEWMIWRDEHGLDGSYEATYDALVVGDH